MADNRDDEGFGTTARGDGAQHRRDALPYLGAAAIGGLPSHAVTRESYAALERDVLRITGIPTLYQRVTPGMWSDETVRAANARIAQLESTVRRQTEEILAHCTLTIELRVRIAQLETEVESLRVERRYVEGRLKTLAAIPGSLAISPNGKDWTVRTNLADAVADAMITGTGWLRTTLDEPKPDAEPATHAKPFPAKAMR
jgi:hypothetical protein